MFKFLKKTVPVILVLTLVLSGCGKGGDEKREQSSETNGTQEGSFEAAPGEASTGQQPAVSDMSSEPVSDTKALIEFFKTCVGEGDRFTNLLMDETAAYFYGMAGTAVSSLRLAVERILWLKGEGENFASLSEGSRYTDWDTIAEICYASPYPYYFEGLICEIQGETEKASELYQYASIMANFPNEGLNFYFLRDMSIEDLYKLRDELREAENSLYTEYYPVLYGYERSVYNCMPEYLLADAIEKLEKEQYRDAYIAARYAVRGNPKNEDFWMVAVVAAMSTDEPYLAVSFLDEGLKYFPDGKKLDILRKSINDMADEIAKEVGEE